LGTLDRLAGFGFAMYAESLNFVTSSGGNVLSAATASNNQRIASIELSLCIKGQDLASEGEKS
jgi:hypothetical protein